MDLWPGAMLGEALKARQSESLTTFQHAQPFAAQGSLAVAPSLSTACRIRERPCHEGADVCRLLCTSPAARPSGGIPSNGGVGPTVYRTPLQLLGC